MKKIILPVVLILLIGISGFVVAQNIESKYIGKNPTPGAETRRDMYEYTFKFHKGWNLMPPIWYGKGKEVCQGHLKSAFIWTPKGYVGGKLNEHNAFNLDKFDEEERKYIQQAFLGVSEVESFYISTSGAWVYADGDCEMSGVKMEMSSRQDVSKGAQDIVDARWSKIKLQNGWNIGVVFPDMFFGDKLSNYFKQCQIEKIATWNPEEQKWDFPPQEHISDFTRITSPREEPPMEEAYGSEEIRADWYWKTFIIKVSNDCSLSYSRETNSSQSPTS